MNRRANQKGRDTLDEPTIRYLDNIRFDLTEAPADVADNELKAYADRGRKLYGDRLRGIILRAVPDHPDEIDICYDLPPVPFNRLRRITGYLVGDLNRWNNGKRAEEHDRVKHTRPDGEDPLDQGKDGADHA